MTNAYLAARGGTQAIAPKKSIVVCGYPKSGTTWLSRLVAELVDCPLQGDFGFADGVAAEGRERESDYVCYKSHRTLASLVSGLSSDDPRIVYVVRDPRDVAISAAHHFRVNLISVRQTNWLVAVVNARLSRATPYIVRRSRTIGAVLYGDASLNPWLSIPWRDHYREFRQSAALVLKYEDMLRDPLTKSVEVLSYLGIPKSKEWIAKAIFNQSFHKKKSFFESRGVAAEYAFLRRGSHGYWRTELGRKHKQLFVDEVGDELRALSYPLD